MSIRDLSRIRRLAWHERRLLASAAAPLLVLSGLGAAAAAVVDGYQAAVADHVRLLNADYPYSIQVLQPDPVRQLAAVGLPLVVTSGGPVLVGGVEAGVLATSVRSDRHEVVASFGATVDELPRVEQGVALSAQLASTLGASAGDLVTTEATGPVVVSRVFALPADPSGRLVVAYDATVADLPVGDEVSARYLATEDDLEAVTRSGLRDGVDILVSSTAGATSQALTQRQPLLVSYAVPGRWLLPLAGVLIAVSIVGLAARRLSATTDALVSAGMRLRHARGLVTGGLLLPLVASAVVGAIAGWSGTALMSRPTASVLDQVWLATPTGIGASVTAAGTAFLLCGAVPLVARGRRWVLRGSAAALPTVVAASCAIAIAGAVAVGLALSDVLGPGDGFTAAAWGGAALAAAAPGVGLLLTVGRSVTDRAARHVASALVVAGVGLSLVLYAGAFVSATGENDSSRERRAFAASQFSQTLDGSITVERVAPAAAQGLRSEAAAVDLPEPVTFALRDETDVNVRAVTPQCARAVPPGGNASMQVESPDACADSPLDLVASARIPGQPVDDHVLASPDLVIDGQVGLVVFDSRSGAVVAAAVRPAMTDPELVSGAPSLPGAVASDAMLTGVVDVPGGSTQETVVIRAALDLDPRSYTVLRARLALLSPGSLINEYPGYDDGGRTTVARGLGLVAAAVGALLTMSLAAGVEGAIRPWSTAVLARARRRGRIGLAVRLCAPLIAVSVVPLAAAYVAVVSDLPHVRMADLGVVFLTGGIATTAVVAVGVHRLSREVGRRR